MHEHVAEYDRPEHSNISDEEVKKSCAMGFIAFDEVPSFSNRERYLCRVAQTYYDILSKNIQELEYILWKVLEDFCIQEDEIDSKLDSKGSEGAKMAFKYFSVNDGDSEWMLATQEMLDNWE